MRLPALICFVCCWISFAVVKGQEINFRRINVESGLSDNLVSCATLDKNGMMWIGSAGGLDSYNGISVKHWPYPDGKDRGVGDLYCDRQNHLWVISTDGELWTLNNNRRFVQVKFASAQDSGRVRYLLPVANDSIYLWVNNQLAKVSREPLHITAHAKLSDVGRINTFLQKTPLANDKYALALSDRVVVFDPVAGKLEKTFVVDNCAAAVQLSNGDMLVCTGNDRELFRIEYATGKVLRNYGLLNDQLGRPVNGYLRRMAKLPDGRIVITSGYGGIYIFDEHQETLTNYAHDPINQSSVSGNNTYRINCDTAGNVFVTTRSSGINYFNIAVKEARYVRVMQDERTGHLFDGFVQSFAEDRDSNIYIGTQGGLASLNRKTKAINFIDYGFINGAPIAGQEEVRALSMDNDGRLWVGLNRYGAVLLDQRRKPIQYFDNRAEASRRIADNFVLSIAQGPRNDTWLATGEGLSVIDNESLTEISKTRYPALAAIGRRNIFPITWQGADSVWLGVGNGVYCYRLSDDNLNFFGTEKGMNGQLVSSILPDGKGNIFFAGARGVEVMDGAGNIKFYDRANGLPYAAVLKLLPGSNNTIWAVNDYVLVQMDADKGIIKVADGPLGIPTSGFRILSGLQASDGTFFLGTDEGFVSVNPAFLSNQPPSVSILISGLYTTDSSYYFTQDETLHLPYTRNSFSVEINSIALFHNRPLRLQYKLEGVDDDWKNTNGLEPVQYQGVPPGEYSMLVQYVGSDGTLIKNKNKLSIIIDGPWWTATWFIALTAMLLALAINTIVRNRLAKRKAKREALETERAVLYFANSMHQHHNIREIVTDLTQNSISKLGFEDCVVYMLDEAAAELYQISAWGDKSRGDGTIHSPIAIPLGKGIVGSVAVTGKAEIVKDTSIDPRYIADDKLRHSEIAVPIIADDIVIGVIDSEHSQKNFFTQKHLSLLTTLASLLGSRLVSIMAEEKKVAAEIALHATQRKTAEVEMQALRAQMNPHFLFNSLNSINNFILKNDADNASAYLTRFSRLMRLILDNSRQDWVTLDDELRALRLYIDMESIRFDHAFDFNITVAQHVDVDYVMVPPMLIQPYVENAIWHGLLHLKAPGGLLKIDISRQKDYLCIAIEDNGVGRAKAASLKSKLGEKKKSHGMDITGERLRIVNEVYNVDAKALIEDLKDESGKDTGTKITLTLHYKNHRAIDESIGL